MAKNENITAKPQKFFFDVNNFDDDIEEIVEEELPPPPPTFSEAELEAARQQGYDQGKRDGLAEAQASREKFVSGVLDTISRNFATLFEAEHERAHRHESEAVHLARAIFRKLFPRLNDRHGLDEVNGVIARVLESHREQPGIIVEVHPDVVADVEIHLRAAVAGLHGAGGCTVTGNPALGPGDARLQWESGGASRSAGRLAAEIEKELDQVLADRRILHDNDYSDIEISHHNPAPAGEGESP